MVSLPLSFSKFHNIDLLLYEMLRCNFQEQPVFGNNVNLLIEALGVNKHELLNQLSKNSAKPFPALCAFDVECGPS